MADYLNQWTSEILQTLKPTDQFVVAHAIYRGIGHLAGEVTSNEDGIQAYFAP